MKLGLILEGGASRTYFSCGVMDALLEEGIIADYVIGTSAGIANAVSYVSGQKGRNLRIAKEYLNDKRYMGFKHMLNPKNKSFYNINFVFSEVPNKHIPFDYEAFKAFKGDVVAVVTNVKTGKAEYLKMPRDDKDFRYLVASCALPLMFPVIRIDNELYMDGGITAPIAIDCAIHEGCDKNIVVLTRERAYRKEQEKSLALAAKLYGRYPEFAKALKNRTEVYNSNIERIGQLEKEGKVFVIAPGVMDCKRTESNPEVLTKLNTQGLETLRKVLPELKSYLCG